MEITYKGQYYNARNQKDLIIKLRLEGRLTYKTIGDLIGKSSTYVGTILQEAGYSGRILYPELEDVETFNVPDELIALRLNIKESRVTSARKKVGVKSFYTVRVHNRRKHLAKALFGNGYIPGPNFIDFIKEQVQFLGPKKKALIEDFYINGLTQSLADDINLDSNRVYRTIAKRELKDKVAFFNPKILVKEGILSNGRSNSEGK